MRKFAYVIAFASAFASPALAETREDRLAVAKDYYAQAAEDMDMERMIAQMYEPILPSIEQNIGTPITADQKAQIHTIYMDTFSAPMADLMAKQVEVMADQFTLDELTALNVFYKTPEGRAVMKKMPDVLAALQPEIISMVQTKMQDVMVQLEDIFMEN